MPMLLYALTCVCYAFQQGDEQAALVAMLFSGQLDSEKKMKEHFLPALKTIATTELEEFRVVAVYMLMMLLNKKPENGISLVTNALPSKVYACIQYNC